MGEANATVLGCLLGGGAMRSTKTGEMVYHLAMLDFDRLPETPARSIEIDFLAHGITPHPYHRKQFVLFEKHGPGCCVVDVAEDGVIQTIAAGPRREFYGHGAFSADGAVMYCTETDVEDHHRGYVAVRDGRTFELLGDFPSFGRAPHDCFVTDAGRTLVIANGGSPMHQPDPPCMVWVDIASQKLEARLDVPDDSINAGHFAITSGGDVALVSAPRDGLDPTKSPGGISLQVGGGALTRITEPADIVGQMLGETLSVAIHEPTRTVGATSPTGNLVTFWNLDSGELVRMLRVPNPRGIALTLDGEAFVVNFGAIPRAARVDATSLAPVDAPGNQRGFLSLATGSHILMV